MTACTNKARGAVVAALAGVLALGAVPAVALATGTADAGVDLQFAEPDGAFTNAKVVNAGFSHLGSWKGVGKDGYGVYETNYDAYKPMVLDWFEVEFFGTSESGSFKISAADDDYKVTYYERDSKGEPTGDEITSDIYNVGKYVAKVEAVDGHYKGGVIYVPFDINAIQLKGAEVVGNDTLTYNAETHDFRFNLVDSSGARYTAMEGVDYTVEYVRTGHDTSNVADVKDAGTYVAKITGIGNWAGSVTLSEQITVKPLDLATAPIVGLSKAGDPEVKNLYGLFIDGKFYTGDDAIMSELKADLDPSTQVWFKNDMYSYSVYAVKANDANIVNKGGFAACKVENELSFLYKGAAIPTEHEVIISDSSTKWDSTKVTAHADNGTKQGIDIANGDITEMIYDASGNVRSSAYMNSHAGSYTVIYQVTGVMNGFEAGGQAVVNVTVYKDAINADATAAVLFDVDGDGKKEVVTSVEAAYDRTDLAGRIETVVEDADGNRLMPVRDYTVRYYRADGTQVRALIDAGTYTLKLTSDTYKLSGTTEMTVTINKIGATTVRAAAVVDKEWDNVGNVTSYLPWQADGVTLDELRLQYKDGDRWVKFPMDVIKATILDSEGNEVKKIVDEGVYTVHFEGRNPNADNYEVPGDLTVTCIKNGTVADKDGNIVNHLLFRDVEWNDYFANAVDFVAKNHFMTGYKGTKLFGSGDTLTRGQMACVLYNMAKGAGKVDENSFHYTETEGYETGFEDVQGKMFYSKAVAWAKLSGVVNGYDDTHFGPDDTITREQFAAMLMNYEKKFGDYEQADASVLDDFSDAASVSAWAQNAMAWAVENGVVNGTSEGTLIPTNDIVRADAACMVYNYAK